MIHQFSCAYTPQQNSVVERKHQHLLNVACALMFQSNVPLVYWSDCVLTAVFLINRTPSLLLNKLTPYELLFNKAPDYSFLRTFGCLCYVSTHFKDRNKFTARAVPCVFLGYSFGYKGYKVLNLDTNVVSISRNVVFHETIFPFKKDLPPSSVDHLFSESILPLSTPVAIDTVPSVPAHIPSVVSPVESPDHIHASPDPSPDPSHASSIDSHASSSHSRSGVITDSPETVTEDTGQASLPVARPKRQGKPPTYLSDYHCSLFAQFQKPQTPPITPSIAPHIPFPLSSVLSYHKLRPPYQAFIVSITLETEPRNFKEAIANPHFNKAMDVEITALEALGTWSVVSLPDGKHVIGCKWVYTIKYLSNGTIERYKARLVAKGYTQQEGLTILIHSLLWLNLQVSNFSLLWLLVLVGSFGRWMSLTPSCMVTWMKKFI